jgi:exopolyphosphatase/guanosine-5'-triphosphate,3'-diphosphate pyrophosphatase
MALRVATLMYRRRAALSLPDLQLKHQGNRFRLSIDRDWLERNPLTVTALREEVREWDRIGIELKIPGLGHDDAEVEAA